MPLGISKDINTELAEYFQYCDQQLAISFNVRIVKQIRKYRKLAIHEALIILDRKPCLNRQIDNFVNTLKLFARGHQLNPARLPAVGHNIGNIPLVPC